ncbi:hypothetical protein KPA97_67395, partial [Burkholderia cenocepacia]|nr:hypothetical protein [Burkholderia cenocepacia]
MFDGKPESAPVCNTQRLPHPAPGCRHCRQLDPARGPNPVMPDVSPVPNRCGTVARRAVTDWADV